VSCGLTFHLGLVCLFFKTFGLGFLTTASDFNQGPLQSQLRADPIVRAQYVLSQVLCLSLGSCLSHSSPHILWHAGMRKRRAS
jgi:hypothetical protein